MELEKRATLADRVTTMETKIKTEPAAGLAAMTVSRMAPRARAGNTTELARQMVKDTVG
jgi:hypothetical protein